VASLNEQNNIHESRITALRYHVPGAIMLMLTAVPMMATGLAAYQAGVTGSQRRGSTPVMSLTDATVLALVVDLDPSARGRITMPAHSPVDTARASGREIDPLAVFA
jgi:hypothetical protein